MSTPEAFIASKIKLARAQIHLSELRKEIGQFLRGRPFRAVIRAAPIPGQQCLVYEVRRSVPVEMSAVIGDVIHNVRAALDLLMCELVRRNRQSDKGVYFPICANARHLGSSFKRA